MDKPQMDPNIAPPGEEVCRTQLSSRDRLLVAITLLIFSCLLVGGLRYSEFKNTEDQTKAIAQSAILSKINLDSSQLIELSDSRALDFQDFVNELDALNFRLVTLEEFIAWQELKSEYDWKWVYEKAATITKLRDNEPVIWQMRWCAAHQYGHFLSQTRWNERGDLSDGPLILVVRKEAKPAPVSAVVPAERKQVGQSHDWPIWKTITIGQYKSVADLRDSLVCSEYKISPWADDLLNQSAFKLSSEVVTMDLIRLTVAELGFPTSATYAQICARAKELGLGLCPSEVGPELRRQYLDQLINEWLIVAMEPITDSDGRPGVFELVRSTGGLWLHGGWAHPQGVWAPEGEFVFSLRK